MELKHMQKFQGERRNYQIGFIFLILFCAFRPLALLDLKIGIAEYNVMELFAIIISYLLVFGILLNLKKVKFDFISISILWFCSYCYISILWGSQFRTVTQVTLPFILFFAIRAIINEPKQIKLLITVLIITYCFPLVGSFYQIIQGFGIAGVESITGIERYSGMFDRIKPFSYAMFFFSIFFYIQVNINRLRNRQIKWALLFFLIISFFCLFKTYSRVTYLGLFVFWTISLWGYNKKYFFIALALSIFIVILNFSALQQIFFKTQEFDINVASSGRLFLWEHNISYFLASDFDRKLLGNGLGVLSPSVISSDLGIVGYRISPKILPSHNDFLQLLMSLGCFGLFAYLLIFSALLKDVYMSIIGKNIKYFYYGIIFSIIFINFGSGIIVYQVGSSQLFWMTMGFLYVFRDFNATSPHGV
jgi:O-antigen ligase